MKPTPSTSTLRYALTVLLVVITLLGLVAGFNAFVDPFAMYRKVEITGFNRYKPSIYHRMRLFKAFEVRHVAPQTLILGSSRTHIGLRCSHPALAALEGPCYNLAFDGASAKEMYYYLLHANAIKPLKHVILGLDSYHTSPAPAFTRPDFDPLLLASPSLPHWMQFITADLRLLTSMDMLRASIQTLFAQNPPGANWFAPDGQRLGEVFFHQGGEPRFIKHGPRAYFQSINHQEVRDQTGPAPKIKTPEIPADPQESSRAYIRRIIAFCRDQHIDLRIFITPSHIHQAEIAMALWGPQALDTNKRSLVQLLAEDAAQHPDQTPFPLMDFSGYSSVTTEALPPVGSRNEMQFYWDSSHFKQIVGDYVLDKLFNTENPGQPVPADFGAILNDKTLEDALTRQHEAQDVYRAQFPEDIKQIRSLLDGQQPPHQK